MRPKIFSLLLGTIILVCSGVGFGQEKPSAILIDEHGEIPCDDTLGRIDVFFAELQREPTSTGLVVISNPPENKARGVWRQGIIEFQTKWRSFDPSRFKVVRANSAEALRVQFWRIPTGADEPLVKGLDLSYNLPPDIKPFILSYETKFGDQICPEIRDDRMFADFLTANRTARGNIVVRARSRKLAERQAARIVKTLTKYGIRRSRLRTFVGLLQMPPNYDEDIVEYWYLP